MSNRIKNILIYRLGSLGDTVIALPCFHKIRECYPNANIILLTNRPIAAKAAPIEAVLGNTYFFDKIINYPLRTRNPLLLAKLIWELRLQKIDLVINISAARTEKSTIRDQWFFRACGINRQIGFPITKEDFNVIIDPATGQYEWEAKRLSRRIKPLGSIDLSNDQYWDLRLSALEYSQAKDFLRDTVAGAPILAISAGTKMQAKDWDETNWKALIAKLSVALPNWTLIMLGAPDEFAVSERCLEFWSGTKINLCGQTSPRVSAALLQLARVFIGHDSGPMHLAACVGTPCVAIFSARNLPRQWYPRGDKNSILYHKTDCAGCNLEICVEQQKKCILSITVDEVEQAVLAVVVSTATSHS